LVSPGDRVAPHGKSRDLFIIREAIKNVDARQAVPYLDLDTNKLEGIFTEIPGRDVIPVPVDEQLIVELYSK
jgi:small subunit ribosomal protein S4